MYSCRASEREDGGEGCHAASMLRNQKPQEITEVLDPCKAMPARGE